MSAAASSGWYFWGRRELLLQRIAFKRLKTTERQMERGGVQFFDLYCYVTLSVAGTNAIGIGSQRGMGKAGITPSYEGPTQSISVIKENPDYGLVSVYDEPSPVKAIAPGGLALTLTRLIGTRGERFSWKPEVVLLATDIREAVCR